MLTPKFFHVFLAFALINPIVSPIPSADANNLLNLPEPGSMVNLTASYDPIVIKGLKVHPQNPFQFDFIIDPGAQTQTTVIKNDVTKLIKYFLTALTIPENDLWVNLSPYEKNRMIASNLAQTVMGRDMLAQDYILKQLTASLIYPERELGKRFWNEVYSRTKQRYGTTQVPVNTFNKVWIVPDRADVYEHNNSAYIIGAHLKVMLEEDYLSLYRHVSPGTEAHSLASEVVRQIILPQIEEEINHGRHFAPLRQMFYSMILASWYKIALKNAILNQIYGNQSKVKVGINQTNIEINQEIFNRYIRAYKKGVFNYIKDSETPNDASLGQSVTRKYFAGGTNFARLAGDGGVLRRFKTNPYPQQADPLLLARVDLTVQASSAAMVVRKIVRVKGNGNKRIRRSKIAELKNPDKGKSVVRKLEIDPDIHSIAITKEAILQYASQGDAMIHLSREMAICHPSRLGGMYMISGNIIEEFQENSDSLDGILDDTDNNQYRDGFFFNWPVTRNGQTYYVQELDPMRFLLREQVIKILGKPLLEKLLLNSPNFVDATAHFVGVKPGLMRISLREKLKNLGDEQIDRHVEEIFNLLRVVPVTGIIKPQGGARRYRNEEAKQKVEAKFPQMTTIPGEDRMDVRVMGLSGAEVRELYQMVEDDQNAPEEDRLFETDEEVARREGKEEFIGKRSESNLLDEWPKDFFDAAMAAVPFITTAKVVGPSQPGDQTRFVLAQNFGIDQSNELIDVAAEYPNARMTFYYGGTMVDMRHAALLINLGVVKGSTLYLNIQAVNKATRKEIVQKVRAALTPSLKIPADPAAIAPGGIDFNAQDLHMQLEHQDQAMSSGFDQSTVNRIKSLGFAGLNFKIESITPVKNDLNVLN